VFRQVLFANQPLVGAWRYHDAFQVNPVPERAPQLGRSAGEHPFVLEVKVPCSKDGFVTNLRVWRRASDVQLLLAGLVSGSICSLSRGLRFRWVLLAGDRRPEVRHLQEGYITESIEMVSDNFSEWTQSAGLIPRQALFGPFGISTRKGSLACSGDR
jgi:hypothetical protein